MTAKAKRASKTKAKAKAKRARAYSVFTMFSKAVNDHIGLSFSRSAGTKKERSNCDPSCKLWKACYASRIERVYKSLDAKLRRHYEMGPVGVLVRAIADLKPAPIRWARFSVDGSMPKLSTLPRNTRAVFRRLLREFIVQAQALGADWHIPVESVDKAREYRAALSGLGVTVRRTSQRDTLAQVLQSKDPRAWVCADPSTGIHNGCVTKSEEARNIEFVHECASVARAAGQSCAVCPAIWRDSKCGDCRACASGLVDLIIYPFHA